MKKWKLPLVFIVGLGSSAVAAPDRVSEVGAFGGEQSFAYAISDSDRIVGLARTLSGTAHSFLYHKGQVTDLYPLNSQSLLTGGPQGINNQGQIASGVIAADGIYYPAIYDSRTDLITTLGSLGGSFFGFSGVATSINNAGQATGYSYLSNGERHAFFYQQGVMQDIGCLAGDNPCISYANAINEHGQVVGSSGFQGRAFLYANGAMIDISPFGSSESYAHGINNHGEVVGEYLVESQNAFHAFLYRGGIFTDIGNGDSPETVAYGINDHGQIVGATWVQNNFYEQSTEYEPHAFVYDHGVMTDLNSLLPAGSEWSLIAAFAINNKGHVVGYGMLRGHFRAFLFRL